MTFRLSLILLGILITETSAALCRQVDWSPEEHVKNGYQQADVVFKGNYSIRIDPWLDVDVETVWKGTVLPKVSVKRSSVRTGFSKSKVLIFASLRNDRDKYRILGQNDCHYFPDYETTLEVLNRIYGPGTLRREDSFAISWFVSLVLLLLVGTGLWLSSVVKKGEL
jgi:hypothetical protein